MARLLENFVPVVKYAGLNTNKNVTIAGSANFDASGSTGTFKTSTGTTTVGGALNVTGAVTFSGAQTGQKVAVTASGGTTRTLVAAGSGSVNLFDSAAGITYTLPVPVVGQTFDFVWTVSQTSSSHIVITDAGTTFIVGGNATFSATDVTPSATLGPKFFAANGSSHVKFTSNATTLGSAIGSWLKFVAVSTTLWYAYGVIDSPSGTIATPWST